jgi:hypothetical protein
MVVDLFDGMGRGSVTILRGMSRPNDDGKDREGEAKTTS